jgi:peptidoglycan/xylan/chitin deacetylase (PgdA/CDA1 family)
MMWPNICFHGIGTPRRELEPGEDAYWISRDGFLRLLDDVAAWPQAALSFDDGNESDLAIALPALLERGLRAQFFLLAGRLGQPGSLEASAVKELTLSGMQVGSHGMAHMPWRHLTPSAVRSELVEARAVISEAAGAPVAAAACPLGRYDRGSLAQLRRLGYQHVYSSDRHLSPAQAWLQPRFSVHRGETPASLREAVAHSQRPLNQSAVRIKGLLKRLR